MKALRILQSLKSQRIKKGLSILSSAELGNVGRNFITDVEKGKPTTEFGKVEQYARSLGLRISFESNDDSDYERLRKLIDDLSDTNPKLAQRIVSGLTEEDKEQLNSRFVLTKKQAKEVILSF